MKIPQLPHDCSAEQVLAVLDFLLDLHRLICDHYEHELSTNSTDNELYSEDDQIPW